MLSLLLWSCRSSWSSTLRWTRYQKCFYFSLILQLYLIPLVFNRQDFPSEESCKSGCPCKYCWNKFQISTHHQPWRKAIWSSSIFYQAVHEAAQQLPFMQSQTHHRWQYQSPLGCLLYPRCMIFPYHFPPLYLILHLHSSFDQYFLTKSRKRHLTDCHRILRFQSYRHFRCGKMQKLEYWSWSRQRKASPELWSPSRTK